MFWDLSTCSSIAGRGGPSLRNLRNFPPPPPSRKGGGGNSPPLSARKNSKIKEKLKKKGGKSKKSALRAEITLNLPLFCLNLAKIELFQGSRPPNLAFLVKNRIFLRASETLFSNFSGGFALRPPPPPRPLDPHFLGWKKMFPPLKFARAAPDCRLDILSICISNFDGSGSSFHETKTACSADSIWEFRTCKR